MPRTNLSSQRRYPKKKPKIFSSILKAPRLERPANWLSEIPSIENVAEDSSQYLAAKSSQKISSQPQEETTPSQESLRQDNYLYLGGAGRSVANLIDDDLVELNSLTFLFCMMTMIILPTKRRREGPLRRSWVSLSRRWDF